MQITDVDKDNQKVSSSSNGSSSSGDWFANIFNYKKNSNSSDVQTDDDKTNDDLEDLDEAQSLTAKYVQRSPTVPIKVG